MRPAETSSIQIRPTGAALGADVENVDVSSLSDAGVRGHTGRRCSRISWSASVAHGDRRYELIGLARRFGEVEPPEERTRTASMTVPGFPEMSIISNVVEKGVAKGASGDGELRWHTDHGFMETPVALSMLLAREVPPIGGDTSFANMYLAYEELPERPAWTRRGAHHQAPGKPHLDRAASARLSGHRERRSAPAAGCAASDRPYPPGDRSQGALPRAPLRVLCPATIARGERGAARRALGPCHAAGARLDPEMAGGRPDGLGQPLHDASAGELRRDRAGVACTAS